MTFRSAAHCLALAATAISTGGVLAQEPTAKDKAVGAAGKSPATNETAARLLNTQLRAAQKAYRAAVDTMAVERVGGLLVASSSQRARPDLAYTWSVRWLEAQRDLSGSKEERIAAYADHQKRMKQLLDTVRMLVGGGNSGLLHDSEVPSAEWCLAEADLWLLKEQAK
jgi:hypothetical protein